MKARTNISIDPNLLQKAQENYINISGLTENAIRNKLMRKEVEIQMQEEPHCEFCGKEEPKAFIDHQNNDTYHDGLTWLYPDERWICSSCLGRKSKHILK